VYVRPIFTLSYHIFFGKFSFFAFVQALVNYNSR